MPSRHPHNGSHFVPYQRASAVTASGADQRLPVSGDVGPGSVLLTGKGRAIRLGEKLGAGGEGAIFATDDGGLVAKVYSPERLTAFRRDKLRLMVTRGIDRTDPAFPGICWPRGLLFDGQQHFRGYVMDRASGHSLARSVFLLPELEQAFPQWDRLHLVDLSLAIFRRIDLLHRCGVIVGDINGENILVENESRVFFVDCDSFQIEGFPCPVGTAHFTPPELQGANFGTTLRTPDHEAFAAATLVFMVLHLGKHPYACVGGGSPTDNIAAGDFPYPFNGAATGTAPAGPWRLIWSNLPYRLKEAFYGTFSARSRGRPRRTAADWIRLLEQYRHAIASGYLTRALVPATPKEVSAHARAAYGLPEDGPSLTRSCAGCGQAFTLTRSEQDFFAARGLTIPRRCPECRASKVRGMPLARRARVRLPSRPVPTPVWAAPLPAMPQAARETPVSSVDRPPANPSPIGRFIQWLFGGA